MPDWLPDSREFIIISDFEGNITPSSSSAASLAISGVAWREVGWAIAKVISACDSGRQGDVAEK